MHLMPMITSGNLKHFKNLESKTSMRTVDDCTLFYLPQIGDRKGHITSVNNSIEIPFNIKRVFYLYDIPGGESRGAHAHKECHQFLVAVSGAFELLVDDGKTQRIIQLNQPNIGVHVPPGIWSSEINFSGGAVCLVLASHEYNENDYVREYEAYKTTQKK
jgi:dTDP-4-dehydrorhamnose 3,5-epimerase-like enzyme